jgi:hypothetical protein
MLLACDQGSSDRSGVRKLGLKSRKSGDLGSLLFVGVQVAWELDQLPGLPRDLFLCQCATSGHEPVSMWTVEVLSHTR